MLNNFENSFFMHLPDFLFAEDEKEERGRDFGFKLSELFHLFLDFIASSFAADFYFGGWGYLLALFFCGVSFGLVNVFLLLFVLLMGTETES